MSLPILILGAGGHAKVLIDILRMRSAEIIGAVDPLSTSDVSGVRVIGNDDIINEYSPGHVQLVNGIGGVASCSKRRMIFERFLRLGYKFKKVIHPSAIVASGVELGEGVQIMAGAIVQAGTSLGSNSIVNTRGTIEHDCNIGAHAHLAPGSVLCGSVTVGTESFVGASATVIQGVNIGPRTTVGAGSLVLSDIPGDTTAYGVPAKVVS